MCVVAGMLTVLVVVGFREIGQKSSEELAREGSGVKAFSSFLSELSTLVPEAMIPNISVLLTHLEGEVHTFLICTERYFWYDLQSGVSASQLVWHNLNIISQ